MNNIRNIRALVGLDLSEMDDALIEYVGILQNIIPIEKVIFLHNIKLLELPINLKNNEQLKIIEEKIKQKVEKKITFSNISVNYEIVVSSQPYADISFVNEHRRYKSNLLVFGNKQNLAGNGSLTQKLIRVFNTATLLIPETFNRNPENVAQAIDFSTSSEMVVRYADAIEKTSKANGLELNFIPLSVSRVSKALYPGLSDRELERALERNEQNRLKRWDKEFPNHQALKIIRTEEGGENSIASTLANYVMNNEIDLMILGVLGRTDLKGLFLGSVSRALLDLETNTALFFVKVPRKE